MYISEIGASGNLASLEINQSLVCAVRLYFGFTRNYSYDCALI